MTELHATILKMSVHPNNDNPDYGECATHIQIDDEPGFPPCLILKQDYPDMQPGTIKLSLKELQKITAVASEMISQYPTQS